MQHYWIILCISYLVHVERLVHNYPTMNNKSTTAAKANDTDTNTYTSATDIELESIEIDTGEFVTAEKLAILCNTENSVDGVENAYNNNKRNESILLVKEVKSADDLIFPVSVEFTTTTIKAYQQIDLLTSDEHEDLSVSIEEEKELLSQHLQRTFTVTPLNMSDFITLIPASQVQTIVSNYYRHDPEVQRAYNFLASPQYHQLKQQILAVPEILDFLRYLNNSGLNLIDLLNTLGNILTPLDIINITVNNGVLKF